MGGGFWKAASALLGAAAMFATAQAQSQPDRALQVLARPSGAVFAAMYPENALAQGVAGAVVLDCVTRLDQRVDCAIIEEQPSGWDFGPAALAIARSFRVAPAIRGGVQIAGEKMRIPLRFSQHDDTASEVGHLPLWETAPNHAIVQSTLSRYSNGASARGRGVLSCKVKADRTLDCHLMRETKSGVGFGLAAVALASEFKVLESETTFIARHRNSPFLLPINFGFATAWTPVSQVAAAGPIQLGEAPQALVAPFYPAVARAAGVAGRVVLRCTADANLAFVCKVTTETPAGHGFGQAALTLAQPTVASLQQPADASPFLEGDQLELAVAFEP